MKDKASCIYIIFTLLAISSCDTLNMPKVADLDPNLADITINNGCIDYDQDGFYINCGSQSEVDCNDNDSLVFPHAHEICDGIDNDCNGIVDDNMNIGSECVIESLDCVAEGRIVCDSIGIAYCVPINEEICNGIDDNCNGEIDEGNPGGGWECDTGESGICSVGEWTCITDTESPGIGCIPNIFVDTQLEICDGLDNDCDGSIDEGEDGNPISTSCYTGIVGTVDVGICLHGTWSCTEGHWGPCIDQTRPTSEVCNGLDDDCDGMSDENMLDNCSCDHMVDFEIDCYTGPDGTEDVGTCEGGTSTCNPETDLWQGCNGEIVPVEEICDGIDNDCDNEVDEGFFLGDSCTVGSGLCQNTGTVICDGNYGTTCDGIELDPSEEVCDGIDNDCDGIVDDVVGVNAACSVGTGTCEINGVKRCDLESNTLECNATPANATEETCNGLDDDCDGEIDEDFNIGESCTVGVGACERTGTFECSFDTTVVCNVQSGGPGAEICDEIDNDCDGEVDEGFGVGNLCVGIGACPDGQLECNVIGDAICSTNPNGSEHVYVSESCDGIDNNCDGQVDEYYGVGGVCNDNCGEGVYECNPTNPMMYGICSTSSIGSAVEEEVCDGVDNDCDMSIDEGFPDFDFDFSADCVDTDDDNDGSLDVDDCEPQNASISPNAIEQCNGLDDDCNGQVDDNFNFTPALSDNQNGVCSGTQKVCSGMNGWQEPDYSSVTGFEAVEISCDGEDNDCDGVVDEAADLTLHLADNQEGVCANSQKVCSGEGWQEPDYATTIGATYEATETLCDGLDNDCDGAVDEDEGCP